MTSKKILCSFLSGLLAILPIAGWADEAAVVFVDQITPVHLCGSLKRKTYWGPPGFGESPKLDIKRLIWILELRRPMVFVQKGENGKNVEEALKIIKITLISSAFDNQLHHMLGRSVVITGPVWPAISEGDVTPVVIEAAAIAPWNKSMVCTN